MNRPGAIPSADLLAWGLGLLLVGAPALGWIAAATASEFLVFLAVVIGLVGAGALVAGVWAFATNHDRMAARYLADLAAPPATSEGPSSAADLPHRPVMPPLPGRIVATPPPEEEVRIIATPAPPAEN